MTCGGLKRTRPTYCVASRASKIWMRWVRHINRRASHFGFSENVSSPIKESYRIEIIRFFPRQIGALSIAIPSRKRGVGHRHERGAGCGGRGSVRRMWVQGGFAREHPRYVRRTRCCVRQTVWSGTRCWCQLAEVRWSNRAETNLQYADDGGQTNSAPGTTA